MTWYCPRAGSRNGGLGQHRSARRSAAARGDRVEVDHRSSARDEDDVADEQPNLVSHLRVVAERNGEVGLIRLDGELDMSTYDKVIEAIRSPDLLGVVQWAVDCSDLTFLDSFGLRAILSLAGESGTLDTIALYEVLPSVRRILEVAGLDGVLALRDDVSEIE
jgi:anti-anti-sigma factor